MDRLKSKRRPLRTALTRTVNEVEAEFLQENPDDLKLRDKLDKLERILPEVIVLDQQIFESLLDADATEAQIDEESLATEDYQDKVSQAKRKINDKLYPTDRLASPNGSVYSTAATDKSALIKKRTYKLPKIEIKKFNGDLKEWLGFWSQFAKIHEDEELHASDKFQYLVQSMIPGTRAKELVDSYPQSAANYPKVIEALQERFGKKKLLIQVYVRELIKLVISNNSSSSREKAKVMKMYDLLESHLRALDSLGVTAEMTAFFLYPMVESSLPEEILIAWQRSLMSGEDGSKENPPKNELHYLMQFLRKEVENEEQRALAQSGFSITTSKEKKKASQVKELQSLENENATAAGLFSGKAAVCIFCEKTNHMSHECLKAQSMRLDEKTSKVKMSQACFICFKKGHNSKKCKVPVRCSLCSKKHYHFMCPELPSHISTRSYHQPVNVDSQSNTSVAQVSIQCQGDVLLKTLLVRVQSGKGQRIVRLVYDEGSQRSYITGKAANHIKSIPIGHEVSRNVLFDGSVTNFEKIQKHTVILESLFGKVTKEVCLRERPMLGGIIPRVPQGPWIKQLAKQNIRLTDHSLNKMDYPVIDVLIGSDYRDSMMTGKVIQLGGGLTATETIFGWTLSGSIPKAHNIIGDAISMFMTEENISQLWTLEALGIRDPIEVKSKQEEELTAKELFMKTVTRNQDGRYSVRLPWVNGEQLIPSNRAIAEIRLKSTTKNLKIKGKYEVYDAMFKSWLEEGIVEVVDIKSLEASRCHYLPHHAVFKESITTPVRPVFDASSKSKRNPSLNECLYKGPNLMELISSVLLRFREKNIGVMSDVRKAFQMIDVQEEDRDFLRFLWWEDSHQTNYRIYRHKRVVFGVNCSPFLLAAVIELHLNSIDDHRKRVAEMLLKSLYVDNCVTSVDSLQEYEEFKNTSTQIMNEAKMELRQWECSAGEMSRIGPEGCGLDMDCKTTPKKIQETSTSMVLGLVWDKVRDVLSCDIRLQIPQDQILTKRGILSVIQKVYDPIGFTCPAMLQTKLIIQRAWEVKTGWDNILPERECAQFKQWCEELQYLKAITIPRQMTKGSSSDLQIHTFCDASKDAYAAVVFMRNVHGDNIEVQLAHAKARVSPLNRPTIPRLELMACLIGTRLTVSVKEALGLENNVTNYWSDSSTALAWIRRNDNWGSFVGNRVRDILKFSDSDNWRFVPSSLNPADLPSRGCTPSQLLHSKWWEGPDWLKTAPEDWPCFQEIVDEELVNHEKKKTNSTQLCTTLRPEILSPKFSSYRKNVAVQGWIRRFIKNSKEGKGHRNKSKFLSIDEMQRAEKDVLKQIQEDSFPNDLQNISGTPVELKEDGLFHLKTKLIYRNDTEDFKWPILLPKWHPLVEQLIMDIHRVYSHAGVQFVIGILREKYWILQARRTITRVIRSCTICRRYDAKNVTVKPASLPERRVATSEPFETTGVDLAGPLFLKDGSKAWIILFTCAVYRGVHLDLVTSLSTEAFLEALERFINLYGRPRTLYSDSGTNFVGAFNLFKKINWNEIEKAAHVKQIKWIFNPPTAAWWGGWWERLVQSMKNILKRILGRARLNYDQLRTCVSSAAAVINSRPLTTVTEDPEDLIPLTPAMFLRGSLSTGFPEGTEVKSHEIQLQYKKNKNLQRQLQERFRREYLSQLVQRAKTKESPQLKIGDIVLVGADNKKRFEWPMGRILELIPGKDGVERVAKVKTSRGVLNRPVQRLYPLEVHSSADIVDPAAALQPDAEKVTEECMDSIEEPKLKTRSGRSIKKPSRYGQWNM